MRLWSIHPKYLDKIGLVALWREALLAKKVLQGKTKGYKNHPQLIRFKNTKNPIQFINKYLENIYNEAKSRGYNFDKNKFNKIRLDKKIKVTTGQLEYEINHLYKKVKKRTPKELERFERDIKANKIFKIVKGGIEDWEKVKK